MGSGVVGNYYQTRIQIAGVTVVGTTDASGFPASNVLDWQHPLVRWQSNNLTGDKVLVFDLSAAPPNYVGFYIGRVNFTSAFLQANATDSWGAPTHNVAISFTNDSYVSRLQGTFFYLADRSTINLRFARLRIVGGTGVNDGATGYKVGLMVPMVTAVEVDNRAPVRRVVTKGKLFNALGGGGEDLVAISQRRMQLELPWTWLWDPSLSPVTNEEANMLTLAADPETPVVVVPNLNRLYESYLCRQAGEIQIETEVGIGATMPLLLREIS